MLNTYGLRSINQTTFNRNYDHYDYPREGRNIVVTALRINNSALLVLGYIPVISFFSGCFRMGLGAAMLGFTLVVGERKAEEGSIIGRWYDEAIITEISQIARGAIEAFVPFSVAINLSLDIVATFINLHKEFRAPKKVEPSIDKAPPHKDPDYPLLFRWLNLA